MNNKLKSVLATACAASVLAAAVVAFFSHSNKPAPPAEKTADEVETPRPGSRAERMANQKTEVVSKPNAGKTLEERSKAKQETARIRGEVNRLLEKFRSGSPEDRAAVVKEMEEGKKLLEFTTASISESIAKATPEQLEQERANFERDYRVPLDFLKSGKLQESFKTPEEQEVFGTTIDSLQNFLEQLDAALNEPK